MIICLPFHKTDASQTAELLRWIWEIGPLPDATLLLAHDLSVTQDQFWTIRQLAEHAFGTVEVLQCSLGSFPREKERLWRPVANLAFKAVCDYMAKREGGQGWLNCEPDATPIYRGWLADLEAEYELAMKAGKSFMGSIVATPLAGKYRPFLSGVAVYPSNAREILGSALEGSEPWDTASARQVLPLAFNSRLIVNAYHKPGTEFREVKLPGSPDRIQTLDFVPKGCAVFHRTKSSSLINLLRKRLHA